jgi:hypothetical protein
MDGDYGRTRKPWQEFNFVKAPLHSFIVQGELPAMLAGLQILLVSVREKR